VLYSLLGDLPDRERPIEARLRSQEDRDMMRPPVSLSRLRFTPGSHEVVYARKGGHDEPELTEDERIDAIMPSGVGSHSR
jgi:hypothetical protein